MALSANTVWEIRTDGDDGNGGGFVTGATGTDYSQQAAAQLSAADLTMHADTNTKCHPAVAGVAAAHVGNIIYISAGTDWTPGWYEIVSQDGTDWTLDRSPSAAGNANLATFKLGGALDSPGGLAKVLTDHGVSGMKAWIKSGTYTITDSTAAVTNGRPYISGYNKQLHVEGYQTTRGDRGTRPIITTNQALGSNYIYGFIGTSGNAHTYTINLEFDATLGGGTCNYGPHGSSYTYYLSCICKNAAYGFMSSYCIDCYATGQSVAHFYNCYSLLNCLAEGGSGSCSGFLVPTYVDNCVADSCPGVGFVLTAAARFAANLTAYSCGGDGFDMESGSYSFTLVNCYAGDCGGYGFDTEVGCELINCAGYNNTSGNYRVANTPALLEGFVEITEQPLTNPASNDFAPNDNPLGGALLRAAGMGPYSQTYGGDIGAVQHVDPYFGGVTGPLTLSKETGAAARGGSGTCAKLLPLSTAIYGRWTFFVRTDGSDFTLSFYYWCTSGFNGDIDVTIYDVDNTTKLNDAEDVGETADGDWHQFTATLVSPASAGMCRVVVAVKQGAHSAADVIYIDDMAIA